MEGYQHPQRVLDQIEAALILLICCHRQKSALKAIYTISEGVKFKLKSKEKHFALCQTQRTAWTLNRTGQHLKKPEKLDAIQLTLMDISSRLTRIETAVEKLKQQTLKMNSEINTVDA